MICILHGYLLEGSGSNLWTRAILQSLCRQGETVHLMAQENHPERYDFITEFRRYPPGGGTEVSFRRESPYPGRCIVHKPVLGEVLPVYVHDEYEEFSRAVPMVDLEDPEIEEYLERNERVLLRVVRENGITALHANHAVLMSVVARRVSARTGVPFAIFPHGSALEFAVKRDERFLRFAREAFREAGAILTIGEEMRQRVREVVTDVPGLEERFFNLPLGVDTSQFEPITREERTANIALLEESVHEAPRGRTADQTRRLRERLHAGMSEAGLASVFAEARDYDGKTPDADLEAKLRAVDWLREPTLLYVGRLIASKGVQSVVAALPFLLRDRPDLRLLLVGHGPLREPLEALLWALEHGEREMVALLVERGRRLEGSPEGEQEGAVLTQVARFLDGLAAHGQLDAYFEAAREHVRPERAVFTGYLTHRQLRFLFPCCDAAVFPSVVKEAGPLVFLEALASGSFPLGTDFAGMRASIDSIADALPAGAADAMRLRPDPDRTVEDIVRAVPAALQLAGRHKEALYRVARERYDWTSVARALKGRLESM
jgi:glycosyltransferase involved in cell wall biosynthesis